MLVLFFCVCVCAFFLGGGGGGGGGVVVAFFSFIVKWIFYIYFLFVLLSVSSATKVNFFSDKTVQAGSCPPQAV